jgi:putative two-component system response regulator
MFANGSLDRHVLIVDDNPGVAGLLRCALHGEGYRVSIASNGREALEFVAHSRPQLILLDLQMPEICGDEVCRRLKRDPATQTIPIVMLTAQGELENRLAAWEYGADEFLSKPFQVVEVLARCRSLLRIKQLIDERDSAEAVLFALARTVEAKSPYTHGHSERVTRYCGILAEAMGISEADREMLRKGSLLHDIGKISVPDAILNKAGPLSDGEFDVIKAHPLHGAHIVEPLHSVAAAVPLIRSHHERLDGNGYPDGLKGDEIPKLVRLLAVCDVYDSLSSDRPYRPALDWATCVKIMRDDARGGGLDPVLVELFANRMRPIGQADTVPIAEVQAALAE